MRRVIAISVLFLVIFSRSDPAYAYLDAGTGSMILQLLIGGFAGALVVGKLYWRRLKSVFGRETSPGGELVSAGEAAITEEPATDEGETE